MVDRQILLGIILTVLVLTLSPVVAVISFNQRLVNIAADAQSANSFNFAVAGDWSCGSNAKATLSNIQAKSPEAIIIPGDLAYADPSCFISMMQGVKGITHIAIGNHDSPEDGSATDTAKYLNAFGLSKAFYSFDVKTAHFIVMSTQTSANVGSEQYNFVKNDLAAAKTAGKEWIFVFFHKPIYSCNCKHTADEAGLLKAYTPLFDQAGVDIVFQAHNHNYQRTFPINYTSSTTTSNPLPVTREMSDYKNLHAPIYMVVGTGGKSQYSLSSTKPAFLVSQFVAYGALNVEINDKVLKATFTDNSNKVKDQFTIDNTGGTVIPPPPPPPITCPTGQHKDPNTEQCVPDIEPPPTFVCNSVNNIASATGSGLYTNTAYINFYSANKVLDNIVAPYSMWSQYGNGSSLILDMGSPTKPYLGLCGFDIAFYKGDSRIYSYSVSISSDSEGNYTKVFTGKSDGEGLAQEHVDLTNVPAAMNFNNARYVKFDFNGSNENAWNSITEIDLQAKQKQ